MRYGIFSDIHSNLEALEAVLKAYGRVSIDKYLCVGDVVGYAANPGECIAKVRLLTTTTVAGNHDWASVDLFSLDYFNPRAAKAVIWTKDQLNEQERYFLESLKLTFKNEDLTLVHATLDDPALFSYLTGIQSASPTFELLNNSLCFLGHTHVPGIFIQNEDKRIYCLKSDTLKLEKNNKYIVNVGSVGQPRDGSPLAAYSIYDTDKKTVWIKRIDYDFKSTAKKIVSAGLPEFLAERLAVGR
jgi:predicted phosphodiesterase